MHFETDYAWLDIIRSWAEAYPAVRRVWVYGSRVTGVRREKPSSSSIPDLDIAVAIAPADLTINAYARLHHRDMQQSLQSSLPVKVDLEFSNLEADGILFASLDEVWMPRFRNEDCRMVLDKDATANGSG